MRSFRLKVFVVLSVILMALSAGIVTAQVSRRPAPRVFRPARFAQALGTALLASPKTTLTPSQAREQAWQAQEDRLDRDPRAQVWSQPVLRVGQDFVLESTDTARNVVVVFGSATIDGFVDGDVVVCLGDAQLSNTAVVRGSVVVVGGNVRAASSAVIRRDLVVIGGLTNAAAGFLPGGEHISVGAAGLGERIRQVVPWITRGLLWGRPIVPSLAWVWWIAGLFFVVHFLLNLVFHDSVRASAQTLTARPLSTFMAGLLVLLLTGPLALLLVMSVIGVLVVPFALCAVVAAWLIGKVAVTRAIGASVVRQESADSRPQAMRSFVIGSAVVCLLYIIPVIGLMTWGLMGIFGLGSAVLAFSSALRRENPAPPKRATPVPPPAQPQPQSESHPLQQAQPEPAGAPAPRAEPLPAAAEASSTIPLSLADFPRASFVDRLAAFALDLLVVVIVANFIGPGRQQGDRLFFLVLVYYVGAWTWKGTTVGGIICNLRVIRVDGAPLRFADAAVRGLSGVLSMAALGLGGLWILRDPERQAWHDKISATYVVKVPRSWPLP